jgi:hypothetical protein
MGAGLLQFERDLAVEPPTLSVDTFRHKKKGKCNRDGGSTAEFH